MGLRYPMENDDGSIDVPLFFGDDPEEWISWVESYGSDQGFSDFQMRQFAHGFIEGDALAWYYEEISHSPFNYWEELKAGLLQRFGKNKDQELDLEDVRGRVIKFSQTKPTEADTVAQIAESESCFPLVREENTFQEKKFLHNVENLRAEEKDKSPFKGEEIKNGFQGIEEEETPQYEEEKQIKAKECESACQVFEQMLVREKGNTRKKKKRWRKLSKKKYNLYGRTEGCTKRERTMLKNMARWWKFRVLKHIAERMSHKTDVKMKIHTCQVFDKRLLLRFVKEMKRAKLGYKRNGFKTEKYINQLFLVELLLENMTVSSLEMQRKGENKHKYFSDHRKQWSKEKQGSQSFYQVFLKRFLQGKLVKKKRKMSRSKSSSFKDKSTNLDQEKLFRNMKKNEYRGHKTWTMTISQRLECFCYMRNMNTEKVSDKIWPLKLPKKKVKEKMREIKSLVLFLVEWHNQTQQVIINVLVMGVETAKEKMFGTRGKRHKFWHKHKKRLVIVVSFHKKRVFVDQVFKLKKQTRLKLEREFAKPIGVQGVVYVKLLWRFITVKKRQFRKRPKLRKKHKENRTCVVKKEGQGKVFYKMWLISFCANKKTGKNSYHFSQRKNKRKRRKVIVEPKKQAWRRLLVITVAVFHYGIQVNWEKLTGNSINSLCPMKDLADRFVSEIKEMADLENELVKELIQVAYFKREWSFSLGKSITIAAETVSTKNIDGKTLMKVSLATINQEKEARTWGVSLMFM